MEKLISGQKDNSYGIFYVYKMIFDTSIRKEFTRSASGIAVALIAIFVVLWNKCEGFRNFWKGLWEGIKNIVSTVVEALKGFFTGVIDFVKNNWQA